MSNDHHDSPDEKCVKNHAQKNSYLPNLKFLKILYQI